MCWREMQAKRISLCWPNSVIYTWSQFLLIVLLDVKKCCP